MTYLDNKKSLKKLINIISHYIPDYHFTYNTKPITTNITFDNSKDLSKIYYKSSSLNEFIKEIKNGHYGFHLNQYNQSCIQRIYNNISNSKCISVESYINKENIKINIINKSLNINPKITKFTYNNINHTYDICIDENEETDEETEELSFLGVLAAALTSTIKSKK